MKTENETPAKIKNFTPLMDDLIKQYDLVTAAVWGRVWRYEQGKNKVCQASHETIAHELHLSERTVIRKLQQLAGDGYLKDHTPDLRNRPHTYSTTRKARIEITIAGVTESHTNVDEGVTESHSTMTESHSRGDTESHEETKKKQIKKDSTPSGVPTPHQVMIGELAKVTGFDLKMHGGRLGRSASKLVKAGYLSEQIETAYCQEGWWYQNDWRGQKGEMPTPEQIIETIGRVVLNGKVNGQNGHTPQPKQMMILSDGQIVEIGDPNGR